MLTLRKKILLLIVPLFVCGKCTFTLLTNGPLLLFPNPAIKTEPIADTYLNGNSRCAISFKSENELVYVFTLINGHKYPYAGIGFNQKEFLDISDYDHLKIALSSFPPTGLRIIIMTHITGYTKPEIGSSYLFNTYKLKAYPEIHEYIIPLKQIKASYWWFSDKNMHQNDIRGQADFSKVKRVEILNVTSDAINITNTVKITQLQFIKSTSGIIRIYVSILLLYVFIISLLLYFRYRRKQLIQKMEDTVISYRHLEIKKSSDDRTRVLLEYLEQNFTEPDLTVDMVSSKSKVPAELIPVIIKKNFGISFPQYLNALRLNQSKKLLVETDRSITDIALDIGYNNISYFNYLFKKHTGQSPVEFRKNHFPRSENKDRP